LRIWNDMIMGPSVVVKIWLPYKAQVIQKLDSHDLWLSPLGCCCQL